ncbi:hypothetical protein [Glutamicibacter mysorens]|uniref:hypothetical protein n=1 Tax=Glutamicibacter mysorens TaxID=257984 RepID=UPI0020C69E06|nr:hypothetical protein [Glutamicibacter mysorens]UTM47040.1 hypothetical protein XH9_16120 [Glutamicibacter mysorens]
MPTHVFQPSRNPPRWWDRLLVHPLDMTVAVVAVIFGLLVIASLFIPEFIPSKSMDKMPDPVIILVSGFLGTGGVLSLVGLNWWGDKVSHGWSIEQFGWWLAAGGFATYAISVAWHYPGSAFSWGVPLSLGLGSVIRAVSIIMIEQSVRRTLAEVEDHKHE